MSDLVRKLTNKKVYIVSPHFDDAVLSSGTLLMKLAGNSDVTVVNIFTEAHTGPYTLSAKKFLRDSCGYNDATKLFTAREKEDERALQSIKVTKIVNLGLTDALFRRKGESFVGKLIPETDHFYPTYRWHIIKNIRNNDPISMLMKEKLEVTIDKNAVVFVPRGLGGHMDHVITRQVCEKLFDEIIYYSDFPYSVNGGKGANLPRGYKRFAVEVDVDRKQDLIKMYKTQFFGLFPSGKVPRHVETYFVKE